MELYLAGLSADAASNDSDDAIDVLADSYAEERRVCTANSASVLWRKVFYDLAFHGGGDAVYADACPPLGNEGEMVGLQADRSAL